MRLIAHRGNLHGPNAATENLPAQVDDCLALGLECEVDLRYHSEQLYLGHDKNQYKINLDWLLDRSALIWIHCKDSESLFHISKFKEVLNYFWHNDDDHTLTSKGYIWSFPGAPVSKDSIAVLPERWWDPSMGLKLNLSMGICTDYPLRFREEIDLV